jgi:hypothetical protein
MTGYRTVTNKELVDAATALWTAASVIYAIGRAITLLLVFIAVWVYCITEYGLLLGIGLGWLPATIIGVIAAYLWPLLLFAVAWFLWMALK